MFRETGQALFKALHTAAATRLGPLDPCTVALSGAAEDPAPDRVAAAQAALAALPREQLEALMAAAHQALRMDALSWLALWSDSGPRRH